MDNRKDEIVNPESKLSAVTVQVVQEKNGKGTKEKNE